MPDEQLTLNKALRPEGVLLLGSLVARQLAAGNISCLMVNAAGVVELVPPVELAMDYLPEQQALSTLLGEHHYTDQQLEAYLRARDWRLSRG